MRKQPIQIQTENTEILPSASMNLRATYKYGRTTKPTTKTNYNDQQHQPQQQQQQRQQQQQERI